MKELIIATRNEKKLRELKRYVKPLGLKAISLKDISGAPDIIEDGRTFEENAKKKALTVSNFTGGLVLADDSGLTVEALNGLPGVKSARFAGDGKSDRKNNLKLLKSLEGLPPKKRGARFVCNVAIADKGRIIANIEKTCRGRIGFQIRGRHGFGYDPLFVIPKYNKTFGELGARVKDRMSHRSKALEKARDFLKKYLRSL